MCVWGRQLMDGSELWATCLWGIAWWGEGRGMGKRAKQPGTFILNRAIQLCKSKLEPLAEPSSSIKDLSSLQPSGRRTTSYSCLAVNKISPGTKHFNLKWFYQEQLTNLSRKLAVWRGTSIKIGKGLWKELMKFQHAVLNTSWAHSDTGQCVSETEPINQGGGLRRAHLPAPFLNFPVKHQAPTASSQPAFQHNLRGPGLSSRLHEVHLCTWPCHTLFWTQMSSIDVDGLEFLEEVFCFVFFRKERCQLS